MRPIKNEQKASKGWRAPTCWQASKSFSRFPGMETAVSREQRANPAVQHATTLGFHLAACVSVANTWDESAQK